MAGRGIEIGATHHPPLAADRDLAVGRHLRAQPGGQDDDPHVAFRIALALAHGIGRRVHLCPARDIRFRAIGDITLFIVGARARNMKRCGQI